MEAKDLMVRDWILHEGEPYQIRQLGIYGVDRDGEDYPAVCVGKPNGVGLILERNEIEPIPLTPEILEKNFESESNIFGLQTYKLNENFNLENRGDRFCLVRKCRDYYPSTFWVCDLIHLHQLQHALRLCGIEKTIEL